MFVTQKALNGRNLVTAVCQRVMYMKWCRLTEEEAQVGAERALTSYGVTLSQVNSFNYLGRVLAAEEDDWPAVMRNLRRTKQKWAWLTQILSREGSYARTSGHIYLAVVQSLMMYRSDTWLLMK